MLFIKRLILFVIAVMVIASAIAISGLNTEKVLLDLYFFKFEMTLGFLLVASLFTGLLLGLILSLFSYYMPLTSQLRQLKRQNKQQKQQVLAANRLEHTDA